MKKAFTFIIILSFFLNYSNAYVQGFQSSPSSSSGDMVKASLSAILAGTATCLLADGVSYLKKNISNKIEDQVEKKAGGFLNGLLKKWLGVDLGVAQPVEDAKTREVLEALNKKETCWDGIAKGVANAALEVVTNEAISWVNTGFDGNPLYIRNMDDFMHSISMQQLNIVMPEIQTKNPIFGNAIRSILTDQINTRNSVIIGDIKNTKEGKAYNDFMGDFTNGGWYSLINNQNNPLSAMFSSVDEINKRVSSTKINTLGELDRNNGFLDVKQCAQVDKQDPNLCIKYVTLTPGGIVADQISMVLGSPIRQIEAVDEINEIVLGFFKKMIDNLFARDEGLYNLGSTGGEYGGTGFGLNIVFDENGKPILSKNRLKEIATPKGFTDADISRPQKVREALKAQKDFYSAAQDSIYAANDVLPSLGELDYCMPGPNPNWTSDAMIANVDLLFKNSLTGVTPSQYMPNGMPMSRGITIENYSTFDGIQELWRRAGDERTTAFFKEFSGIDSVTETPKTITLKKGFDSILPQTTRIQFPFSCHVMNKERYGLLGLDRCWESGSFSNSNILISQRYPIALSFSNVFFNRESFIQWFAEKLLLALEQEIEEKFGRDKVIAAFVGTTSGDTSAQFLIRGTATRAYDETYRLVPYAQELETLNSQYNTAIVKTENNIATLEYIYSETQKIVSVAKARYISERADAGDPVDMQCIDAAYIIDNSPVTGIARKTSGKYNSNLLNQNRIYFDSTL